jgi:hypothetical protein
MSINERLNALDHPWDLHAVSIIAIVASYVMIFASISNANIGNVLVIMGMFAGVMAVTSIGDMTPIQGRTRVLAYVGGLLPAVYVALFATQSVSFPNGLVFMLFAFAPGLIASAGFWYEALRGEDE